MKNGKLVASFWTSEKVALDLKCSLVRYWQLFFTEIQKTCNWQGNIKHSIPIKLLKLHGCKRVWVNTFIARRGRWQPELLRSWMGVQRFSNELQYGLFKSYVFLILKWGSLAWRNCWPSSSSELKLYFPWKCTWTCHPSCAASEWTTFWVVPTGCRWQANYPSSIHCLLLAPFRSFCHPNVKCVMMSPFLQWGLMLTNSYRI